METDYTMEQILSMLRHNFYLYYKSFGPYDTNTQHAYEEWQNTLIGVLNGDDKE